MKSRHNTSVVDLVSKLGQNTTYFALCTYGPWAPIDLHDRLTIALQDGTLVETRVGEDSYFTAVADLPKLEVVLDAAARKETRQYLRLFITAVKTNTGFPRLNDAQLELLAQMALKKGYLETDGREWTVTPAGLEYLKYLDKEAPLLN